MNLLCHLEAVEGAVGVHVGGGAANLIFLSLSSPFVTKTFFVNVSCLTDASEQTPLMSRLSLITYQ